MATTPRFLTLADVAEARAIARRAMRIVRQNLAWAVAYNATCVPLALLGWFPPWAAGLGMALVAAGLLPEGGRYEITQGVEMGRPSRLHGRVEASGGRATRCHVAGQVQPVASGDITVPV